MGDATADGRRAIVLTHISDLNQRGHDLSVIRIWELP